MKDEDRSPIERAEDIEYAMFMLGEFRKEVLSGEADFPENILEDLKWATAVLLVTSDLFDEGFTPKIATMLLSPNGVSFKELADEIPGFCKRIGKSIESRRERLEYQRRRAESPPDDVPF